MELNLVGGVSNTSTNMASTKYTIDNSSGQLFGVLSELYSRPVDSCIREISTNCNDAHIMSRKENKPFIITLPNPEKKLFSLSFRDFGPGLNESNIDKIFTYGSSSKRDDVEATGCLGLGAKSPYAITDTFYIKSYCDGKLTQYICFKDERNEPNKSKDPKELDTLEENGLEIIIPIWDEYDYIKILKTELKYFKVKPLVFRDLGNGEKEPVHIDWEIDTRKKLTENVFINNIQNNPKNFFDAKMRKACIVEQLQIWYPLDKDIILKTIDRYNNKKMYFDGSINDKYKISKTRIKIIELLLEAGVKIVAKNEVSFSPSRETIKYNDRTLEFLISVLVRAAKHIEKYIESLLYNIKTLDDYFINCVVKKDLYNILLKTFPELVSDKFETFDLKTGVKTNVFGILDVGIHTKINENFLLNVYDSGYFCTNIGYKKYKEIDRSTHMTFEWQTQKYQAKNLEVLPKLILDLYREFVKNTLIDFKKDISDMGVQNACEKRGISVVHVKRDNISMLGYLKYSNYIKMYKEIKYFIKHKKENLPIDRIRITGFQEFENIIILLLKTYKKYVLMSRGEYDPSISIATISEHYQILNKIVPKITKNTILPQFDIYKFYENLVFPNLKREEHEEANLLTTFFAAFKIAFTYNGKNYNRFTENTYIAGVLYTYYSLLYNPFVQEQHQLQQLDLRDYNKLAIERLEIPEKVKIRIDPKNYFLAEKERKKRSIPELVAPWYVEEYTEEKFQFIIKRLKQKIGFLKTIYEENRIRYTLNNLNLFKLINQIKINYDFLSFTYPDENLDEHEKILYYIRGIEDGLLLYKRLYNILNDLFLETSRSEVKNKYFNILQYRSLIHNYLKNSYNFRKASATYTDYIKLIKSFPNLYFLTLNDVEEMDFDGTNYLVINVEVLKNLKKYAPANYAMEFNSVPFSKIPAEHKKYNTFFSLYDNNYGEIQVEDLLVLLSKKYPVQSFGKMYIKAEKFVSKEEILENYNILSERYKLVSHLTIKQVDVSSKKITLENNDDFEFALYPSEKRLLNLNLERVADNFKNAKEIVAKNYLFLPQGEISFTKAIPKKLCIDYFDFINENSKTILSLIGKKSYFHSSGSKRVDKLGFQRFGILSAKYQFDKYVQEIVNTYFSVSDETFTLYISSKQIIFYTFSLYNIYKFAQNDTDKVDIFKIIEGFYSDYKFEKNEFYPEIEKLIVHQLTSNAKILWETLSKYSVEFKDFPNKVKEIEKKYEELNQEDFLKYIMDDNYFEEISTLLESLSNNLDNGFDFYKGFVIKQKFKQLNNKELNFISDGAKLQKQTKESLIETLDNGLLINNDLRMVEMRNIIDRKDTYASYSSGVLIFKTLFENFPEDILNFHKKEKNKVNQLLLNIEFLLNKSASFEEKIKRKLFKNRNITIKKIPDYYKEKWSYLKLSNEGFKKYIIHKKINKKGNKDGKIK